jgi:hypothetical protein
MGNITASEESPVWPMWWTRPHSAMAGCPWLVAGSSVEADIDADDLDRLIAAAEDPAGIEAAGQPGPPSLVASTHFPGIRSRLTSA